MCCKVHAGLCLKSTPIKVDCNNQKCFDSNCLRIEILQHHHHYFCSPWSCFCSFFCYSLISSLYWGDVGNLLCNEPNMLTLKCCTLHLPFLLTSPWQRQVSQLVLLFYCHVVISILWWRMGSSSKHMKSLPGRLTHFLYKISRLCVKLKASERKSEETAKVFVLQTDNTRSYSLCAVTTRSQSFKTTV